MLSSCVHQHQRGKKIELSATERADTVFIFSKEDMFLQSNEIPIYIRFELSNFENKMVDFFDPKNYSVAVLLQSILRENGILLL